MERGPDLNVWEARPHADIVAIRSVLSPGGSVWFALRIVRVRPFGRSSAARCERVSRC